MAIKLDISTNSIVVYCTECGHWRAFAWTKEEAHAAAVRHERNVHPEQRQAEKAQHKYLTRHAAETTNVDTRADDRRHGNSGSAGRREAHI